jgi:hypothetical protein
MSERLQGFFKSTCPKARFASFLVCLLPQRLEVPAEELKKHTIMKSTDISS